MYYVEKLFIRFLLSETICTEPIMPGNATSIVSSLNEQSFPFNSSITYICHDGLRFNDGYTSKTIKCTQTGKWNETVSSCESKKCV